MAQRTRRGELERAVMEQLWAADGRSLTVRDVHDALSADREIAYTTVMTVLQRLAKKGAVTAEQAARAYRYRAAGTRDEMTADVMREALDRYDSDERRAVLVKFVDQASAEEVDALREALARLDARA